MHKGFYGVDEQPAFSYLEFGSIDMNQGKKNVWDFRMHQQAYDWFMHARYSNDLITYLKLAESVGHAPPLAIIDEYRSGIHHADDFSSNFGKLCALAVMQGRSNQIAFFELGQTLFGCIEGMEFCQKIIRSLKLDFPYLPLHQVRWQGVDTSGFFNRLAVLMHPGYDVTTSETVPQSDLPLDVFFAKGVTLLYALREPGQFLDMLNYGRMALFDYSFSLDGKQEMTLGTGKQIVYLAYDDCEKLLQASGKPLRIRRSRARYDDSTKRVFVDAVYGEAPALQAFIELDARIRASVAADCPVREYDAVLFNGGRSPGDDWVSLADYIDGIRARKQ